MNSQYDVYMCRCEFDGYIDKLEIMLSSESYGDAYEFIKSMNWKSDKWKLGFYNAVCKKPKSSLLRRKPVIHSITNLL